MARRARGDQVLAGPRGRRSGPALAAQVRRGRRAPAVSRSEAGGGEEEAGGEEERRSAPALLGSMTPAGAVQRAGAHSQGGKEPPRAGFQCIHVLNKKFRGLVAEGILF